VREGQEVGTEGQLPPSCHLPPLWRRPWDTYILWWWLNTHWPKNQRWKVKVPRSVKWAACCRRCATAAGVCLHVIRLHAYRFVVYFCAGRIGLQYYTRHASGTLQQWRFPL